MTRIIIPWGRRVYLLIIFLAALLAFLPLRLALDAIGVDERGLSARSARGTLWFGRLDEARFGPFDAGTLDTQLNPLALLIGRAQFHFERAGTNTPGLAGTLISSRNRAGVRDLTGTTPITGYPAALPFRQIQWTGTSILFVDGQCREAAGSISASLAGDAGGAGMSTSLTGQPRCDGGRLALDLAGETGLETLSLRISGDGRYEGNFLVRGDNELIRQPLLAQGFRASADGLTMPVRGRF